MNRNKQMMPRTPNQQGPSNFIDTTKDLTMISNTSSPASNFLPMAVAQPSFLLDRLGQDCRPEQFLRELTQNSIEAIAPDPRPG